MTEQTIYQWQCLSFIRRTGRVVLDTTSPSRERLEEYIESRHEEIQPYMIVRPLRHESDYTDAERDEYDAWIVQCQQRADAWRAQRAAQGKSLR